MGSGQRPSLAEGSSPGHPGGALPALLSFPTALYAAVLDATSLAEPSLFFLPFPVLKRPQPNKPFPARMVQTHRPPREGLNLSPRKPRGRRLPAQLPVRSLSQRHRHESRGTDLPRSAAGGTHRAVRGAGAQSCPAVLRGNTQGCARGRGLPCAPGSPGGRAIGCLRPRGPGPLRHRTHAEGTQAPVARHPRERGAAPEPRQEAPAANRLHTSAGSRAKAAALLAELLDSTQASPWPLELFPFKLKVVMISQTCEASSSHAETSSFKAVLRTPDEI